MGRYSIGILLFLFSLVKRRVTFFVSLMQNFPDLGNFSIVP